MKTQRSFATVPFMIALAIVSALTLTACGKNDAFAAKKTDYTKSQLAEIENRTTPFSVVMVDGVTAVVAVAALPGEAKYVACGACHGAQGGGGVGPQLAGQTAEYIVNRLTQYKNGEKVGSQSNLMWAQAGMLSEADIQDLAEYVTTF
jgi:cytochrome c553